MFILYSQTQFYCLGMSSKNKTNTDGVSSKATDTAPSLCELFPNAIEDLGTSTSDWWVSQDYSDDSNESTPNAVDDENPMFQFKTPSFLHKTPQLQVELPYDDTSPCQFEPVVSGLSELIGNPHTSNTSWSSSMATPSAYANLTLSNLNTEERKLFLPREDKSISTIQRHLFFNSDDKEMPGKNIIADLPGDHTEPRGVRKVLDLLCSPVRSANRSSQQRSTHDIFSSPTTPLIEEFPLSPSNHLPKQLEKKPLTQEQESESSQNDLSPKKTQVLHSTVLSPIVEEPNKLNTNESLHKSFVEKTRRTYSTHTNSSNVFSNSSSTEQDVPNLDTTPKISLKSRLFKRKKNLLRRNNFSSNKIPLDNSIIHTRHTSSLQAQEQPGNIGPGLDVTSPVQSTDNTWVTSTPLKLEKQSFTVDSTPIVNRSDHESTLTSCVTSTAITVSNTLSSALPHNCSIIPTSPVLRKRKRNALKVRQPEKEREVSRKYSPDPSSPCTSIQRTLPTTVERQVCQQETHNSIIPHTSAMLNSTSGVSSSTSLSPEVPNNDLISPKHIPESVVSKITDNIKNKSFGDFAFDSFDSHTLEEVCKATEELITVSACIPSKPCVKNKTIEFNSTVKQKSNMTEPKEVATRVKAIRSSSTTSRVFCYPMSIARKENVNTRHATVIVDDLIKSAHLLEQVANLEPKDQINNLPPSACISEFVPFSRLNRQAQREVVIAPAIKSLLPKEKHVDNILLSESVLTSFPVDTSVEEEPNGTFDMSCTQVTRLVKDAELMLRSENLFWDLGPTATHTEDTSGDLKTQNKDKKRALSSVMQEIEIHSDKSNGGFKTESNEDFRKLHMEIPNESCQLNMYKDNISNTESESVVVEENSNMFSFADRVLPPKYSRLVTKHETPLNDIQNTLSQVETPVNKIIHNYNLLNTAVMKLERCLTESRNVASESDEEKTTSMYSESKSAISDKGDVLALTEVQHVGFSTASEKAVDASESLWKAKNLFLEVESSINENTNHITPTSMKINAGGFSTASGKKINISELSLLKARNLFKEVDSSINESNDQTPAAVEIIAGGFSTASGKKVNISERSQLKARNLFKEVESAINETTNQTPTAAGIIAGGFSTASGKKVNISERSLLKARNLFKEVESSINERTNQTPTGVGIIAGGFSTASGKKVSISEQSLAKARNLFKDVESSLNESTGQTPTSAGISGVGFSTASGKKVNFSEQSLARARNLFKDVESSLNESTGQTPTSAGISGVGFSTASGKKVNFSEQSLARARNLFKDVESSLNESTGVTPTSAGISGVGFSTASGKKVNFSEQSLARARNLFKDVESSLNKSTGQTPTSAGISGVGFSTASGKKVNISEQSLARARNLFKDVESSLNESTGQTPTSAGISGVGFSTASGKKVNISEQSLARARNLFKDVDSLNESTDQTLTGAGIIAGGFSTVSGKKVNVSEQSLAKVRNLFKEDESAINESTDQMPTLPRNNVEGFSTASGKKVNTSEASLRKVRLLFSQDGLRKEMMDQEVPNVVCTLKVEDSGESDQHLEVLKSRLNERDTLSSTTTSIGAVEKVDGSEMPSLHAKPSSDINNYPAVDKKTSHLYLRGTSSNEGLSSEDARMLGQSQLVDYNTASACKRPKFTNGNTLSSGGTNSRGELLVDKPSLQNCPQRKIHQSNNISNHTNGSTAISLLDEKSREARSSLTASQYELDVSEVVDYVEAFSADEAMEAPTWVDPLFCSPSELTDRSCAPKPMVDCPLTPPRPNYGPHDRFQSKSKTLQKGFVVQKDELRPTQSEAAKSFKVPYIQGGQAVAASAKDSMAKKRTALMEFGTPFAKRLQNEEKNKSNGVVPLAKYNEKKKSEPSVDEIAKLRAESLEQQKTIISNKSELDSRPCEGSLLLRKRQKGQVTWAQLARGRKPGMYTRNQLLKLGVREAVVNVTSENAASFVFSAHDHYGPNVCRTNVTGLPVGDSALLVMDAAGQAGMQQVEWAFLSSPGIDPKLVPKGWVQNHFRWIVWKLAATEKSFPGHFAARCLTPNILMLQLKYRYDREIDRSEHPSLRRILERNEPAARRIVLCVAGVTKLTGDGGYELQLTDGWYGVTASVDTELQKLVTRGAIRVGTKLMSHGAELVGCEQGCYPLEAGGSNVRLKLCANSTRRARWDSRLGFQANPGPLKVSLTSLLPSGGSAGRVDVYIARVYPTLYVEKKADGNRVIRSGTAEQVAAALFERERQESVEKIYSQVRSELMQTDDNVGKRGRSKLTANNIRTITSGEELNQLLEQSADPASLQAMMTEDQLNAVAEHRQEIQDVMLREMESRMRETLGDGVTKRDVSSLTKIRCLVPDGDPSSSAILSVWRGTEDVLALLSEGATLTIFNLLVSGSRGGCLQLSTGRQTCYKLASYHSFESGSMVRSVTRPGDIVGREFRPLFGEVDTVGVVVHKGAGQASFQTVYLASHDLALFEVAFWGGIKEFGCEDLLGIGAVVCAINLQWRHAGSARTIPCVYASENSYFSCHPRQSYLQNAMKELTHTIQMEWTDMNQFTTAAANKVMTLLRDTSHTRSNQVTQVRTQPAMCSPLREVPLTPTQRRLEQLRKYADPPPLTQIVLSRPLAVSKEFQVPFRQDLTSIREETNQDSDSPPLSLDGNDR